MQPIEEKAKKLLGKKKLTSLALGQLLIKDLVASYNGTGLMDEREFTELGVLAMELEDALDFFYHKQIHAYLLSLTLDYRLERKKIDLCYLEILRHFMSLIQAEEAYKNLSYQPRIMTRRDYELCLKESMEKQLNSFAFLGIVSYELAKTIPLYEGGEYTEYNYIFDELKSLPLSSEQLKQLDTHKDNIKAEVTNQYEYLKQFSILYHPKRKGNNKNTPYNFKKDFSSLTKAILSKYSKYEGLEFLNKLKKVDYCRADLISFQQAHDLDILDARELRQKPTLIWKGLLLMYGVAVIEDNTIYTNYVDKLRIKNGSYYYQLQHDLHYENLAERFLENTEVTRDITSLLYLIKQSIKRLNAFSYALDVIIKITKVKEIEDLKLPNGAEIYNDLIKKANFLQEDVVQRYGFLEHEQPAEELAPKLTKLFTPDFDLKDVVITKEEAKRVEEILDNETKKDRKVKLIINYLTGLSA